MPYIQVGVLRGWGVQVLSGFKVPSQQNVVRQLNEGVVDPQPTAGSQAIHTSTVECCVHSANRK